MPQTIDQKCAQSAYEAYKSLKASLSNDKGKLEKIFGYAKKLPMMIIHSGLPNALMFKIDDHKIFVEIIMRWLTGFTNNDIKKEINDKLLKDSTSLRYYTVKAMRWLEWFNRFADTEN